MFSYAFTQDPLGKKTDTRDFPSAGVSSPDSVLDLRNLETLSSGGAFVRVQNELVDMTSATNRLNRMKEYDRLVLSVPEIEMAMTVFSDEACVVGSTPISTVYDGSTSIEWLANNKANEKFPVYCYDFEKEDYTIGWAYAPRFVKIDDTVEIVLDNGTVEIVTPDHRVLKRNGTWINAGDLKFGDELMPFYKVKANQNLTQQKTNQFPRIYTHHDGWIHERQFIDEWRLGKNLEEYDRVNKVSRLIASGLTWRQIEKIMGHRWDIMQPWLHKNGFSFKEIKYLSKSPDKRRVIGIRAHKKLPVYDLSVEDYKNFCTDSLVMHNCQRDENGKVFKIECANKTIADELEYVFFDRGILNFDQQTMWDKAKRLFIKGDLFLELVLNPDNPKEGVYKIMDLPCETMYRIETIKGKVIEFQQSKEAPDYQALVKAPIDTATEAELQQSTAIRFSPEQIIHIRIGDYRRTFYPYGVSLIEPARGPAHQLRMMEDAMVIYRLCLAGNTRIRTNEGYKYIKDVKIGDNVFTLDRDTKNIVKSDVVWWVNNGKQKTYSVKSKHNEIIGNETHPILVNRDGVIGYVDIKDIIPKKDKFLNISRDDETEIELPYLQQEEWTKLTSICRQKLSTYFKNELHLHEDRMNYWQLNEFAVAGNATYPISAAKQMCDNLGLKHSNLAKNVNPTPKCSQFNLPRLVTEDFAKLFGFLIGDGHLRSTNCNSCTQLGFTCGTDKKQNAYYARLLKKFFGKIRFSKDIRSKSPGKFEVDSKYACYLLLKMGYIPGAKNKRIPAWTFMAKKSIRKAFIQGLADADAHIRKLKTGLWTAEFAMCNKKLIEDVKELWHSIGLSSGHIRTRIREGGHYIKKNRRMPETTSHEIYISEKPLNKYETIDSVTYVDEQDIFDVTVNNESHNIVVNGVVTAQTRAPERRVFYIDIGTLPGHKAEAFMDRIKDQFRKKKVPRQQFAQGGPSVVDERWHAPAQDEDFWIPTRPNSNTKIDTLPGACLSLNTEIPLLDGRILKLSEIIEEFNSGKQLWAYSCNPETGKPAPGLISWAGVTRKNTQVVKVNFDNGESIVCTPDHKFPIIGKGFVQAKDLTNESVIAFNTRLENLSSGWKTKYTQVYDSEIKDWVFVHRMVGDLLKKTLVHNETYKDDKKTVIHHCDYNHFNNNPENLFWMNFNDHKELHKDNQGITNTHISEALKQYHENLSEDKKKEIYSRLSEISKIGTQALNDKLQNSEFNDEFRKNQIEGWIKSKLENPELHEARSKKITNKNNEYWSNPENKKIVFEKQTIFYPKDIFEFIANGLKNSKTIEQIVIDIKNNPSLIDLWVNANRHIVRENVDFIFNDEHVQKAVKQYGCKSVRELRHTLGGVEKKSGRPKTPYPKDVMNEFMNLLKQNKDINEIIQLINSNQSFKLKNKLTRSIIYKMIKSFGYSNLAHARKHADTYNHRIISVEYLDTPMDTGTLTIDEKEVLHNYHTFAVSACYVRNSNLGEIDDAVYFRNKLFTALNFPKNYFSMEDPNATRITLSAQDVKFARMIERLQAHVEEGLYQIADRHLKLKGYPSESYEDLAIKMTPPSDWRELSRAEIVTNRINNANGLKSSQLMSDYDILTKWMKYTEDEAKEMLARLKVQKLEDLKLQILAQNPQLLGVGMPTSGEPEVGTEPGQGAGPNLGPESGGLPGAPPGEPLPPPTGGPPLPPPPTGGQQPPGMMPPAGQAQPLPNPTESDIVKYDLEIEDYESEMDFENRDETEVEDV